MVVIEDYVTLVFKLCCIDNPSNIITLPPEDYCRKAKVLSEAIISKIESVNCKYIATNCTLKLPNDKEEDLTSSMSNSKVLENVLEEVIGTLNTEDESPSLEVSIDCTREQTQSSDDDDNASQSGLDHSIKLNNKRKIVSISHRKAMFLSDLDKIKIKMNYKINRNLCNYTETSKPNYVGLVNQAMTCYLNSLLQALYMTPEFRNALYNWEYNSSEKDTNNSIPYQLQKLFLNLQTSQKTAVETTSLTRSFGWDSNEAWHQHDIQELCRVMFDALEHKFKNTAQADLINRLYEGKINDYVKCLSCNTEKSREDTFLDIPLPVRPFGTNVAYGSVEEALEAFVKYETLEGNNQYFCEKCDKKSDAHKGLKFTKFPYILTLQLKRFDFDQNSYHRIKLNDKVTFPDVLNLNTFIESTVNQESLCREEDAGMSVKCDDSITTDSTMEEGYTSSDITMSNSNHLSNHDQDDDEGIDVSNGMSLSSCSMHNNNTEKIREEYAAAKGPYIYELFSIMIHSGSASGGHYYAYIKDFRTDKWLCFNDQIVTPITQDEIQKTYGGGNKQEYFSGAYRCSTNAYMLMYRQKDLERNALPMKTEDFPPHIMELLKKMKKSEEERNSYHDEPSFIDRRYTRPIYYRHPETGEVKEVHVSSRMSMTLRQVAEATYKEANLDNLVDFDQCRIVSYFPQYDLIDSVYENSDDMKLEDVLAINAIIHLLLDIRKKSEPFESYPSTPVITKVYVIDTKERNLVDGPKYIRAYNKQTIKEFKQELKKHFDLDLNIVQLLCQDLQPNNLLDDDFIFDIQTSKPIKIGVTDSYDTEMLKNLQESVFFRMCEYLDDIVTFYVDPIKVTKEQLIKKSIPTLEEYYRDEKTQDNTNSQYSHVTEEMGKISVAPSHNAVKSNSQNDSKNEIGFYEIFWNNKIASAKEEYKVQETSNSEDSSLSDSDRTLVGDVPEESELDCESALSPADQFTGSDFYSKSLANKNNESELVKYFNLSYMKKQKLWKISMDYRVTEDELKEKLETKLNIPKDYFRLSDYSAEYSSNQLIFKDDRKYIISLGRIRNADEVHLDVYNLNLAYPTPIMLLFTIYIKRNITIGNLKKQIRAEYKRENNSDLPNDRWLLIDYVKETLGAVLANDDRLVSDTNYGVLEPVCLYQHDPSIYIRRCDRTEMSIKAPEKILLSGDNMNVKLKETISTRSNIPMEYLELCPMVAGKVFVVEIESYNWKSDISMDEIDFKTYVLYRDTRETPKILTEEEKSRAVRYLVRRKAERVYAMPPTPMNSSPRKEKALKIHVDPS